MKGGKRERKHESILLQRELRYEKVVDFSVERRLFIIQLASLRAVISEVLMSDNIKGTFMQ